MRVLVTGGDGQLARALADAVPERWQICVAGREGIDITTPSSVRNAFDEFEPQLVINAAAYTAVDKAEQEPEKAFAINTDGARTLAEQCAETGARLIHISTDFVFDGRKSYPYQPDDTPHPMGVYGSSKREGERLVLETLDSNGLVIRTAWLYGAGGRNFVTGMLARMQQGQALKVVSDQVGTPTWTRTLADALWQIARKPGLDGIWHFTDAGVASWYDFAVAIQEEAEALGLLKSPVAITPVNSEAYKTAAMRPYYSVLDKSRTWEELGIVPVHWRLSLRGMLKELSDG